MNRTTAAVGGYGLRLSNNGWVLTLQGNHKGNKQLAAPTLKGIIEKVGAVTARKKERTLLLIYMNMTLNKSPYVEEFKQCLDDRWSYQQWNDIQEYVINKKVKMNKRWPQSYHNPSNLIYTNIRKNNSNTSFPPIPSNNRLPIRRRNQHVLQSNHFMNNVSVSFNYTQQQIITRTPCMPTTFYSPNPNQMIVPRTKALLIHPILVSSLRQHHGNASQTSGYQNPYIPNLATAKPMLHDATSSINTNTGFPDWKNVNPQDMRQTQFLKNNQLEKKKQFLKQNQCSKQDNNTQNIMEQLSILNKNMHEIRTDIGSVHKEVGNMDKNVRDLNKNVRDLNKNVRDLNKNVNDLKENAKDINKIIDEIFAKSSNSTFQRNCKENNVTKAHIVNRAMSRCADAVVMVHDINSRNNGTFDEDKMKKNCLLAIKTTIIEAAERHQPDPLAKGFLESLTKIRNLSHIINSGAKRMFRKGQIKLCDVTLNVDAKKIAIQDGIENCVSVGFITYLNLKGFGGEKIVVEWVKRQSLAKLHKYHTRYMDIRFYHLLDFNVGSKTYYMALRQIYCRGVTAVDQEIDTFNALHDLVCNTDKIDTRMDAFMVLINDRDKSYSHVLLVLGHDFVTKNNIIRNNFTKDDLLFISTDVNSSDTKGSINKAMWWETKDYKNGEKERNDLEEMWISNGGFISHVYGITIDENKTRQCFFRPVNKEAGNEKEMVEGSYVAVWYASQNDDIRLNQKLDETLPERMAWPAQVIEQRIIDLSELTEDKQDDNDDDDIDTSRVDKIDELIQLLCGRSLCMYKVKYLQMISDHTMDVCLDEELQWVFKDQCFPLNITELDTNDLTLHLKTEVGTWLPEKSRDGDSTMVNKKKRSREDDHCAVTCNNPRKKPKH